MEEDAARDFKALFADQVAFRLWYEQALPRVYGYVVDRCGGQASLAQELTQETFVQAIRHRDRFDGKSDPVTWLCGIARHKVADHYRGQDRERRRFLRLMSGQGEPGSDQALRDPTDERAVVLNTLRLLPDMQRAVLVFHYLDGLAVRDIAGLLGRSESAVESLLARGREGFRRLHPMQEVANDE